MPELDSEFADARLGDERLRKRLLRIARSIAEAPSDSFPTATGSDGELEGVYRFFSNSRVSMESVLEPHHAATRQRCAESDVLVLHDTTGFAFRGSSTREGLGRLQRSGRAQSRQGFFGHFALAASADGDRQPLGLLGLRTFVRAEKPKPKEFKQPREETSEAARWAALALAVHSQVQCSPRGKTVHRRA